MNESGKAKRMEPYIIIESCLDTLLQRANISRQGAEEVQHFIDHGEYGLAIVVFIAACQDDGVVISDDLKSLIVKIEKAMGCTVEQLKEQML
ncbi:MAG: hypothetical protein AB9872_12690 [Solidesulfovibrio sp.]